MQRRLRLWTTDGWETRVANTNALGNSKGRLRLRALGLVFAVLFTASSVQAMGLGAYFDYGHGWGGLDGACNSSGCFTTGVDVPWDRDKYGVGFLLDTNVAKNSLFNYRLNAGYQRTNETLSGTGAQQNMNGLMIRNTFGFGLVRTENFRFFLGPVIRFGFQFPDSAGYIGSSGVDIWDLDVGGGLNVGMNFHLGDSLSLTIGPVYEYLATARFLSNSNSALIGSEHVLSVNMGIMFRSASDRFDRK